jgi:uncharacterized membrane protein HdeD (DUF308 family)
VAAKQSIRRQASGHGARQAPWRRALLLLAVAPLGVGILLIIMTTVGFIVWDTPMQQVIVGGFYILFSFAASNAVQKEWKLAAGWTLLGVAAWLALNRPETGAKVAAAALMGLSVTLLSKEFLRRRRQALESGKGKPPRGDDGSRAAQG